MKNPEGFALIPVLLVLLAGAVVLGVVGYLAAQRGSPSTLLPANQSPVIGANTSPQPGSAVSVTSTAGWQTYRNEQYGFEFKYPSYFTLDFSGTSFPSSSWEYDAKFGFEFRNPVYDIPNLGGPMGAMFFTIRGMEDSNGNEVSIEDFLQHRINEIASPDMSRSDAGPVPLKERTMLPGKYPAYKLTFSAGPSCGTGGFPCPDQGVIYIFKDNLAYEIFWQNPAQFEPVADAMYQTFQFTSSTSP